jgi:hypothetical protein
MATGVVFDLTTSPQQQQQQQSFNFDPFSSNTTANDNNFNVDWSSAFDSSSKKPNTSNGFTDPFANFVSPNENKSIFSQFQVSLFCF